MADILFNNAGVPLIAYGKSYQASTTGTPSEKPKNVLQPKYPDEEYLIVGDTKIAAFQYLKMIFAEFNDLSVKVVH
jgi:hypothetical protein